MSSSFELTSRHATQVFVLVKHSIISRKSAGFICIPMAVAATPRSKR